MWGRGADGLYTQSSSRPCKPLSIRPPDTVRAPAFILGKNLLSYFFLIARRHLRAAWDAVGEGGTSRGCASLGLDFVGRLAGRVSAWDSGLWTSGLRERQPGL